MRALRAPVACQWLSRRGDHALRGGQVRAPRAPVGVPAVLSRPLRRLGPSGPLGPWKIRAIFRKKRLTDLQNGKSGVKYNPVAPERARLLGN